jgi:fluoroacetyl-CoA thioesterase
VIAMREDRFTVERSLLTDVDGTIPVRVLSTPGMIAKMERCAAMLALDHLPEGRASVGFEVCVKHVAAAYEGADCVAHAILREIVDERKLRFDIDVREGDRVIGLGTHERRAVDRS